MSATSPAAAHGAPTLSATAILGALGVVYGDIGTSPLYALKEATRAASAGGLPTSEAVLGVLSLIIWALILIISLKYAVLIMRADNRGEGGILALLAVLRARHARPRTWRAGVLLLGLVGAALLYGDGAITPAISVLSALEGLKVDAPALAHAVVPLTVAILFGLFLVQRHGTGRIGGIFGPVMLAWFVLIGILGIHGIVGAPQVLAALNPLHGVDFLLYGRPAVSLAVLGATFLAVTGGEAMYADMGHFGRGPIRLAWFAVVLPALALNYFGQGALLLVEPDALENPFYRLAPDWLHYPLIAFATLAAIIASQSIITGAFSLTQQAIQLGFLPRISVRHTSDQRGQIYVPLVNWMLAATTLGAVVGFGSSEHLAGAYGIAVSLLMAITAFLAALVALQWGFNPLLVVAVNGFFLTIDLVFFAANSTKLLEGGWFPLLLAATGTLLMLTWRRGQSLAEKARSRLRESEKDFIQRLLERPAARLPGSAAFLSSGTVGIPLPLTHHLRHLYALPERVLLVTVLTAEKPRVSPAIRGNIERLPAGFTRVILHFGFMEAPCIPEGLVAALDVAGLDVGDPSAISYYIGQETIIPTEKIRGMAVWREALYSLMQRNAERSAAYFGIPAAQAVELGLEIEI